MEIKTVGIIGMGALGVLYADLYTRALGRDRVLVLADGRRTARYRTEGIYLNGQRCGFRYTDAAAVAQPVDLLLFAVKFGGLAEAVETCRHLVGADTILLSVLNGITSEQILSDAFGAEKVVWCTAQKMSAVKEGNQAVCRIAGDLALGVPAGGDKTRLHCLTALLDRIGYPYTLPADIRAHMWSKLLCNTGCNQAAMVFECGYGGLQQPGEARDTMIAAMGEVVTVARAEGIPLSKDHISSWVSIIDSLPPDGEPSMRQDGKARRCSEVELFSGTIRRLAAKHGLSVPVNDRLYARVQEMERDYR